MNIVRRLGTPLGGAVMLFVGGLPWARISCGQVHAEPTLWTLAEQEWELYAFVLFAILLVAVGIGGLLLRRRAWAVAGIGVTALAAAGWAYLLLEREKLVERQIELQGIGGDVGRLLSELEVHLGVGLILYGAAVGWCMAFGLWDLLSYERSGAGPDHDPAPIGDKT